MTQSYQPLVLLLPPLRCPSDEALASYGSGELAAKSRVTIEQHIDGCDSCREVVGALARQSAFLQRLQGSRPETEALASHVGVGDKIARYTLVRILGEGATGRVFAGFDPDLDRLVAIKVMRSAEGGTLCKEAAALARMSDPNVVAVHEVGQISGHEYIVMEYVDALSLPQWLAVASRSTAEITSKLVELARGLVAVHAQSLVHRDIKPDNVLVGGDNRLRLGDFGLAVQVPTQEGEVAGSLLYMAPEQQRGAVIDARADQYGFALTALEALRGSVAIEALNATEILNAKEEGVSVAGVPARLGKTLSKALAPKPSERYASMSDLLVDLRRAVEPKERGRGALWIGLGGVAALAAVALLLVGQSSDAESCSGANSSVALVWNDEARASLGSKFEAPYGANSIESIRDHLDGYAGRWKNSYEGVCRATLVEKTQPKALMRQRMQCLEDSMTVFRASTKQLASGDEPVWRKAWDIVGDIPSAIDCESIKLDGLPAMTVGEAKERTMLVDSEAELRIMWRAGRFDEASQLYEQLATIKSGPHSHGLVSDIKMSGALLAGQVDDKNRARELREEALLHAELAHDNDRRTHVLSTMLIVAARDAENLEQSAALLPLVAAASNVAPAKSKARSISLQAQGWHYATLDDYPKAIEMHENALLEVNSNYDMANQKLALCQSLTKGGRAKLAAPFCQEALAGLENILGPDHPLVGVAHNQQATSSTAQGQIDDAIKSSDRAIAIFEAGLGRTHINTLLTRHNRGILEGYRGNYQASLEMLETVLPMLVEAAGNEDRRVASLHRDIVNALYELKRYAKAEEMLDATTSLLEKVYPPGHHRIALAHQLRGKILAAKGDYEGAREATLRAYEMIKASLGPKHPSLAHILYNLGGFEDELGHKDRALQRLEEILTLSNVVPQITEAVKERIAELRP